MTGIIVVNVARCIGCHTCEVSCVLAHSASKTLVGALAESPRQRPRVHVEQAGRQPVPIQCRHCRDALCVEICPKDALGRAGDDAPVLFDQEKCIGCGFCEEACPFGAITPGAEKKQITKCDLCTERLDADEEPACCDGCPTGALEFAPGQRSAQGCLVAVAGADGEPEDDLPAQVESGDSDAKRAICQVCERDFGARRQVDHVREKLGEKAAAGTVCPACRRSLAAARFSAAAPMIHAASPSE